MNSRLDFEVLKFEGQTAKLAVCRKCDLKFLTPRALLKNADEARFYLAMKFDLHCCAKNSNVIVGDQLLGSAIFGAGYSEDRLREFPRDRTPRRDRD